MIWIKWYMIVFVYAPLLINFLIWLQILSIHQYIKRHYFLVKKDKFSFIEVLSTFINILLLSFIPLLNIIWLLAIIGNGKESIIEKQLLKGMIKEKDTN